MSTGADFSRTIQQWVQERQQALQQVARSSIQDLAEAVVEGTRVDTGNLRAQWQPSIGAPALTLAPQGHEPLATLSVMLGSLPVGTVFYLINNAAYAMRREYGFVGVDSLGRYYNDAGDFNVQTQIARWPSFVGKNAQEFGFGL
jgi:hypothetical protein